MQQTIHDMMILMWRTTLTPTRWKQLNTVLLYKKGDKTDVKNYRPVGLANTICKLWTRILTVAISRTCEEAKTLHYSQVGFRAHRNALQQLDMLTHTIEDAHLRNKDLFVLYIDFSNAFNTIKHDKLWKVLKELGFPAHTIRVIQQLYTDSNTTVAEWNQDSTN